MHREAFKGVAHSKPKLKPGPRVPDDVAVLSKRYLRIRNEQMRAKNLREQMLLSKARDELILKELVVKQGAYLLVSLRQRVLSVPDNLCRKLVNIPDPKQARMILREAMLALLNELKDLPSKVVDPNWLASLDEADGKQQSR